MDGSGEAVSIHISAEHMGNKTRQNRTSAVMLECKHDCQRNHGFLALNVKHDRGPTRLAVSGGMAAARGAYKIWSDVNAEIFWGSVLVRRFPCRSLLGTHRMEMHKENESACYMLRVGKQGRGLRAWSKYLSSARLWRVRTAR